jgi:hypothetical protein
MRNEATHKSKRGGALGYLVLFAVSETHALERGDISFYLSFDQGL